MMFTTKNLIALPLLHFSQNSIAIFQYFNKLESYWNIAIYCNNSINCNLLQYRSIKRRSVRDIDFNLYKNSAINIVCTTCVRLYKVRANNMNHNYQLSVDRSDIVQWNVKIFWKICTGFWMHSICPPAPFFPFFPYFIQSNKMYDSLKLQII